jgi:hypothetical protein
MKEKERQATLEIAKEIYRLVYFAIMNKLPYLEFMDS